eukprot:SAG11_NODE_1953_length_4008_cov_5.134561_4_plen_271_part_00
MALTTLLPLALCASGSAVTTTVAQPTEAPRDRLVAEPAPAATGTMSWPDSSSESSSPVIFWHSEAQGPNTTVLAMGAGLEGASVQLQDAVTGAPVPAPRVLGSWEASVKFSLPPAPTWRTPTSSSIAYRFRACSAKNHGSCSGWRSINSPDITWASGDRSANASAVATPSGWLKVYGRSLGFSSSGQCAAATVRMPGPASGTVATLTSGSTSIKLIANSASCYDATFALPSTLAPGQYNLSIVNRLSTQAGSVAVTIVKANRWPSKVRCC